MSQPVALILAAKLAAFLFLAPAEAQQVCVETGMLKDAYRVVFTHAQLVDLRDEEAQVYLARLNETPPRSSHRADRVLITIFPASALVSLSRAGQVCDRVQIGLPLHHALMTAARGRRI